MKLTIKLTIFESLPESSYNHNYYKMPFTIDGFDTILEIGDDDRTLEYFLGSGIFNLSEGKYYGCSDVINDPENEVTLEDGLIRLF